MHLNCTKKQLQQQKSDKNEEKTLLKEKREDMKTKQEKHDMVQEMLDSEQKLQFTMQNYNAQAQINELTEKNEDTKNESTDHSKIPGARDSAKAFLQSKGITVDSPSEQHVSFSSFTKQPNTAPPVQNTQAPVGKATVNRAHAAYQSATPHPSTPKPEGAGAALKAKA